MESELVELLWEKGQVVLHSQTHHLKPGPPEQLPIDYRMQVNNLHDHQSISRGGTVGASCQNQVTTSLIQNTETVSWIDDSFEMEFDSNLLCEFPISNPVEQGLHEDGKFRKFGVAQLNNHPVIFPNARSSNAMNSWPRFHASDSQLQGINNIPSSVNPDLRPSNNGASRRTLGGEVREYSSAKTVGSSHCGSNLVVNDIDTSRVSSSGIGDQRGLSADVSKDHQVGKLSSQCDRVQTETVETAITSSSSGGSDTSFGRTRNQSTNTNSHKRKSRDAGDSECQSKVSSIILVILCVQLQGLL